MSNMPSTNDFWTTFVARNQDSPGVEIDFAMVDRLDARGGPVLVFVGESAPSQIAHARLRSYVPQTGEMVVLINGIIVGGVVAGA